MTSGLLAKHLWLNAFYHHTWSYSLNVAKPEHAIYRHAVEGLQTPAENILFIDDKSENIAAALSVGMQAVQYTSHDTFEQEMRNRGLDHLLQLDGHTASQIGKL